MRQNWFEFGEYCLFAEEWGCNVGVNTVINPPTNAVHNLPAEDLRTMLETMERQSADVEPRLRMNRAVWLGEIDRVRRHLLCAEASLKPSSPTELVVIL